MGYLQLAKEAVQVSLGAVYKNDYRLIAQHCHELTIVGAFYHYYRELFENQFNLYSIDMEYSRMGGRKVAKEINVPSGEIVCPYCHKKHGRRIRSDFIMHKPGTDDNWLVIEFKGIWSSGCKEWDEVKLCALTKPIASRPTGELYVCGYKLGVSILLKEDGIELQYFANGEKEGNLLNIPKKCLIDKYNSYMDCLRV